MNIQINDFWLREFIDTKATPKQIGECLSLCSQSVEKITKDGNDFIYDIEITTNRPDCLSVYGIARELNAVLPRFGIKAKLKKVHTAEIPKIQNGLPLEVKISKTDLCPRFTALVYDNITIKPSPQFVQKRLKRSGVRALNNVIDISNYLMLELGQPMHTFDYDKILKHKMILRESKDGEEIITLDSQKRILPSGAIVIEDGEGRIIDLCGIMGAKNSETDENTKRVLLFVQTYDPMRIRRATQALAFRTEAAFRFEKGIDPEGVISAMKRATLLFKQWCEAKPASLLTDIYPYPPKTKTVTVSQNKINQTMGIDFETKDAKNILESLGFKTKKFTSKLECTVPHWRNSDIDIPEDLVEEIARIYGYHNLPNVLPPLTSLNYQKSPLFEGEDTIKDCLKHWGFTETSSYSMVGKNLISDPHNHLKISNPLTDDLVYLRTSLIPSLLAVIAKNQTEEEIKIFEMANVYLPKENSSLPDERIKLGVAIHSDNFFKLKGIIEALFIELGIENYQFNLCNMYKYLIHSGQITINKIPIGVTGEINLEMLSKFQIKTSVTVCEIDIADLLAHATKLKKFTPLPKYPAIIEDLSFIVPPQTFIGPVIEEINNSSELIKSVRLIDSYENTQTLRITYQSSEGNLTDHNIKKIREKIISRLSVRFQARLRETS